MKRSQYFFFSLSGITHSTCHLPLSPQGELGEIGLDGLDGEEVSNFTSQVPAASIPEVPVTGS